MVDLLLVGATGYTGKLITRYLAVHRERDSFRLGLAARSKSKLDQLVSDLNISSVPRFTVDAASDASIAALLKDANPKVVLSTVGPYYVWGMPLVRACAKQGVHYVDINGETHFVRKMIMELDYLATKMRAILIPSCGFDSLPADALNFLAGCTLREALLSSSVDSNAFEGVGIKESHTMYTMKGGISGGTLNTVLTAVETLPRKELMRLQAPDILSPIKLRTRQHSKLVYSFPAVYPKRYGFVSFLAPHNITIVQRTRGLLQLHAKKFEEEVGEEGGENVFPAYAEDFTYTESLAASNQVTAFFSGLLFTLGTACLLLFPPTRWLVRALVTPPGQGPSDEALEKGFLNGLNISVSSPLPGNKRPCVIESRIRGRGDPGYALTAVMCSEVALALLAPREKLLPLARAGGVLTPMSALGSGILKRLSASGRFEFESSVLEEGDK